VKRIQALKNDGAKVKGQHWGKAKTVGDVAVEAAQSAKDRLAISGGK
jgi:hypothetical protein